MTKFNEDSRVKIPTIFHFARLGYEYLPLRTAAWDSETNIFPAIFKQSIANINSGIGAPDKLDRLVDLRLEGEITKEELESKKYQLKERQYELSQLILSYDKADDQFSKTLCALLTIASDSDKIWVGSTISEKRELLNFVFANLQLKGATLCYTLRKPFDNMLNQADCIKWRTGRDSNPR